METIKKNAIINAPVADVFNYLEESKNLPDIWPSMVEVKNAKKDADGRVEFDWTYKMAGMLFHGHCSTVEVRRNQLRVLKNDGIPSTFHWTFEPRGEKTAIKLEIDYELPVPLLGRLAEPFLRRINDRDADTLLANLKEHFDVMAGVDEIKKDTGKGIRPEPPTMHH